MFSHLVTAAKGLLTRHNADEASPAKPTAITDNEPKMVTTRRGNKAAAEPETNGTPVANGKMNTGKKDGQSNKRRRSETEVSEDAQDESEVEGSESKQEQAAPEKKGHIKFGSEEPELPEEIPTEEAPVDNQEDDDESSDDDAPEAIDNSAQLSKIKLEAQKQEKLRQREEQLKKQRRKQLDEQRKAQVKLAAKKKDADDVQSESSGTLQGSTTQDTRRSALPALLPDEILNAAPATRPPTPPIDDFEPAQKKPNKLKFLDKKEKRPKDVRMGDTSIRVLDEGPSRKKAKTTLAPKASKTGRNVKDTWLNKSRSTASVNGLRRTAGGSSGFVRR
ncbi:hypothetical protein SI65_08562 [Aspergillus cristatus]|uniref:Immediate-early protein n=1 Tax=Aspergillus cristatus TaxID=573508 RepID=A0A1E3B5F7_ASPCR|nr:hypothetical protein SI65_08562 [Aspergillus cristatus]